MSGGHKMLGTAGYGQLPRMKTWREVARALLLTETVLSTAATFNLAVRRRVGSDFTAGVSATVRDAKALRGNG